MIDTTGFEYGEQHPFTEEKNQTIRELEKVFEQTHSTPELFYELTECLKERFGINKSVLIIKDAESVLSAISTWTNGQRNDGLSLNLPHTKSLFEKVMEDGQLYTELFSDSFSGNFFERKLLLDDTTKSFALQPLNCDGRIIGLIGFSSDNAGAFSMLEEGDAADIMSRFAELIHKQN